MRVKTVPKVLGNSYYNGTFLRQNIMATYNEAEDLINIGAYKRGSNPNIDRAINMIDQVNEYLLQETDAKFTFEESVEQLAAMFQE